MDHSSRPLPSLISQIVETEPNRTLIQEVGGRSNTYRDLQDAGKAWAAAFKAHGVGKGDCVATLLTPSLEVYHCWMGLAYLGAIDAPVNTEHKGRILAESINRSKARIVVVADSFLGQLSDLSLPAVTSIVVVTTPNVAVNSGAKLLSLSAFLASHPPVELTDPQPWDIAGIISTSGTTGQAKGVLVTWAMMSECVAGTFPGEEGKAYPDGAYFCPWQPYHLSGRTALEIAVRLKIRLVLHDKFSVSQFWDQVNQHRCTHFLVAFIAPWLWRAPPTDADSKSSLRRISMVPLLQEWQAFAERFNVEVTTQWASTEAGFPFSAVNPPNHRVAGRLRDGYEVRLVDEHDYEVADGEVGELVVRHVLPWRITPGYFDDPEATNNAWKNGWFHTGDGFIEDNEGWYYFVDRLKDYIKYRGKNVSTTEVEREVSSHPDVVESACVGVPSDLSSDGVLGGEDIRIFVTLAAESRLSAPDLYAFLEARMANFMLPRFIDIVPQLPRNHINKVAKLQLRGRPVEPGTWDREMLKKAKAS